MNENVQDIELYPNPVKNVFSLSKEVRSGVLYNVDGAKKAYEFNNQHNNIDISSLNTGVYLLQVTFKDESKKTLKLVKE